MDTSFLTPPFILGAILLLPFLYYSGVAIRNIYLHPLSGYPGPKVAAASHLWYGVALSRGLAPQQMLELHNKYGPVVRVAPDELSFCTAGAIKQIYGFRGSGQPELSKDPKYHAGFGHEPTLANADRDHHSTLRKLLSYGFSDTSLRAQEAVIQEHVTLLLKGIREQGQDGLVPVDVEAWFTFFTFDVIGYLTFGESFRCLSSSNLHLWIGLLFSRLQVVWRGQAAARFPTWIRILYLKYYIGSDVAAGSKTMREMNESKIKLRINNPSGVPDFMEKLIEAYGSGKLSSNQLNGNAEVLIGAGSETTASLLSGLTYLLCTHPRVHEKLVREIRGQFASGEEITMVGVNGCKYLRACIEEALRIYPPSPATHPRYTPPEGIEIDGTFVPGNIAVGVPIYAACRSGSNFRDPDSFVPERWTGEDVAYVDDIKAASQVFSYGPRNCIGRNLAYVEMKLVMASLLWYFDIQVSTSDNWLNQRVHLGWEKRPLMVKLIPVVRTSV